MVLSFMRFLWGLNHRLEATSRTMKRTLGVTALERMVLRMVGYHPGISAGQLAALLRLHPSSLTALLKRISRRGLVVRCADPRDARRALFTLTARGQEIDGARRGTVEEAVRAALESLPRRDVDTAAAVLDAITREMND